MDKWFVLCAWCKKQFQRSDEKIWRPIKNGDQKRLENQPISHGICPTCYVKFEPKDDEVKDKANV